MASREKNFLKIAVFLVLLTGSLVAPNARAHDPSKSYLHLTLETNGFTGQWDVPIKDLQTVLPLDADHDGFVTWDELNARYTNVTSYVFTNLIISVDGRPVVCRVSNKEPTVEDFSDGTYVEIPFAIENTPSAKTIDLDYRLFFDVNSLHRGLMQLDYGGKTQTAIFSPDHSTQSFVIGVTSPGRQFLVFLREGIFHIWTGYDHILFLVALLLPAVLRQEAGKWRGVSALRPAFINVLKIVTAFTAAHSITLSLAALQVVRLPSRLTESAIALSVVLAAANNLWPVVRERGWIVAFFFGLVHGFGFANALADLGLVHGALALTLVGFNLGVEVGQLAIVSVFLPVAFALRNTWFYQNPLLRFGSALIVVVAATWLAERVFDFKILPF
jgi:hypothetical protein